MKFFAGDYKSVAGYLIKFFLKVFLKLPGWAKLLTALIFFSVILQTVQGIQNKFQELTQPSSSLVNSSDSSSVAQLSTDPFSDGVRKATNAAKLAQTARTLNEWNTVASEWQAAINFMKAVSPKNQNYKVAQERILTYPKNLGYAQANVEKLKLQQSESEQSKCTKAVGQIWADVRLYRDSSCNQPFATIVGGGKLKDGNKGVLIKFNTGEIEWKRREAVRDQAYVKADDPGLSTRLWRDIDE